MKAFWILSICIILFSRCDIKEKNFQFEDFLNNISQTDHNKTFQKLVPMGSTVLRKVSFNITEK